VRILFHVNLRTMLRHFDSVILELAGRGHDVRIASSPNRRDVAPPAALSAHERISFVEAPRGRTDAWAGRIGQMRGFRDYLRYLDNRFNTASRLRGRAIRKFAAAITDNERSHMVGFCARCENRLVDGQVAQVFRQGLSKTGWKNLQAMLALMEDTIPSDPELDAFMRAEQPDVFVVTPLIRIGSSQPDFVKSASALGIPTVFPVFSWDNLTTKGLVHVQPGTVLVWNEQQRREAIDMHAVPWNRIVLTGAPRFDAFFAMRPSQSREEFCGSHGFDPSRPIVTYLGSSPFVSRRETEFVPRWVEELRRAPELSSCQVLLRPHPRCRSAWKKFRSPPGVTVALPEGLNADQTLFDAVHHSEAVVGLNTSAELEAGIVGRPVLTILAPEFAEGQQGSLHFDYLLKENGGFVEVAADFETHRRQLAAAVGGRCDQAAIRSFITEFLRPHGLDRPASGITADAIESAARPGGTVMPRPATAVP
jgi:hypothetical protein